MNSLAKNAIALAKRIQKEAPIVYVPPSAGTMPQGQMVLPHALVRGTGDYIEKVVYQINGCYEKGWYDGCAVMMRRLVETMIIECFESYDIASKIKDNQGNFFHLEKLVNEVINESLWNLGRNTKIGLGRLKKMGDQSAHGRRFIAHREDIDKIQWEFRCVIQEFVSLAKLK